MNSLPTPFESSESIISNYNNETLGFDPLGKKLVTRWFHTSNEEQQAIAAHAKEIFHTICNAQPKNNPLSKTAKCMRLYKVLSGLERIEKAHESTRFDYSVLYQGVKQTVAQARKEVDKQILLNYTPGALFIFDSKNHLQIDLMPLDIIEREAEIAKKLISIIDDQDCNSELQNQLMEKLSEVQGTASKMNCQILSGEIEAYFGKCRTKREVEARATSLNSQLQARMQELWAVEASHFFNNSTFVDMTNTLQQCLSELSQFLQLPEKQLAETNRLVSELKSKQTALKDLYIQKMHTHIKSQINEPVAAPISTLKESYKTIIDYKPTYSYLCINAQGVLDYSNVSTFDQAAVQTHIINRIRHFESHFAKPELHKGDLLRLGHDLSEGLKAVIDDYQSYREFAAGITAAKIILDDLLTRQKAESEKRIVEVSANPGATPFNFLASQANEFPLVLIMNAFVRNYGPDLTEHLFSNYIPKSAQMISREEVRDLLFAIAADVKPQHLIWKHGKPVDTLTQDQLSTLLNHFRKAPNGQSLFEYFKVPLTWDKHCVDDEFLKTLPLKTDEECHRANAIQIAADIESAHMWHGNRRVRMNPRQMYLNLDKLFSSPFAGNAFHSDRYLSFLAAASTCIALLQDCNGNTELVRARMPAVLNRIEDIIKNLPKDYPEKYIPLYRQQWELLHDKLLQAINNPQIDPASLLRDLLVHPLMMNKEDTLAVHDRTRPSEYLARKVGYWNKYYLESRQFLTAEAKLKDHQKLSKLRVGTLFHLAEGKDTVLYQVRSCEVNGGMVYQICTPFNTQSYIARGQPIPLKIIFQGTIIHNPSYSRDYAITKPGHHHWAENGFATFCSQLGHVMIEEQEKHKGQKIAYDVELTGHSLGGSDAQNCAAEMGAAMEHTTKIRLPEDLINSISVVSFNPAGVPIETINTFNAAFEKFPEKLGKIIHAVAKDDVVQVSGSNHLGAGLKLRDKCVLIERNSTKGNGEMDLHCDLVHGNTGTTTGALYPLRVLDAKNPAHKAAIEYYLHGFAYSYSHFAGHAVSLVTRNPVVKAAASVAGGGSLMLAGLIVGGKDTSDNDDREGKKAKNDSLFFAGATLAVGGVAKAVTDHVNGTQILEGND